MKLTELLKSNKETQQEFFNRTIWYEDCFEKYVLVWNNVDNMRHQKCPGIKISWNNAEAYLKSLNSNPEGPCCIHSSKKECNGCGKDGCNGSGSQKERRFT